MSYPGMSQGNAAPVYPPLNQAGEYPPPPATGGGALPYPPQPYPPAYNSQAYLTTPYPPQNQTPYPDPTAPAYPSAPPNSYPPQPPNENYHVTNTQAGPYAMGGNPAMGFQNNPHPPRNMSQPYPYSPQGAAFPSDPHTNQPYSDQQVYIVGTGNLRLFFKDQNHLNHIGI